MPVADEKSARAVRHLTAEGPLGDRGEPSRRGCPSELLLRRPAPRIGVGHASECARSSEGLAPGAPAAGNRRMSQRTGTANLPLHGGRVPEWLRQRMARLGRVIVEAIALRYGRDAVLERLAHPFWFQAFGAVMGMDWHSSGITTSVVGALKRGLGPVEAELGLRVCGGRGRHSRATPRELRAVGERTGLDGDALARTSRLVAKVDSACLQDGYQLYLHAFVVADDGRWVVVQQGLCDRRREARRYHWRSEGLRDFVDAPHAAIDARARTSPSEAVCRQPLPGRAPVRRGVYKQTIASPSPAMLQTTAHALGIAGRSCPWRMAV